MASGTTLVSDIVVPAIFTPYVQQQTAEKSRLIRSGAVARDNVLDMELAGGGLTFNAPSFKDLDNDADNVSSDSGGTSTANKIGTSTEIAVRLSRNSSWKSADLASDLAGADPLAAIGGRVGYYWARRLQAILIAEMKGIFANNDAATDSYHTQYDLTHDISASSFVDGVTNFSAEAFIDAATTMGDSEEDIGIVMVHSIVHARMKKNNLIDFIPDSTNPAAAAVQYFNGKLVIVDDSMPATGGVYDTWMFGAGALRLGMGSPRVPTEVFRNPDAGNGGGTETLYSRMELALHPCGHAYVATAASGGPSNAATSNNLAHADSWRRVFGERKQIKIARLKTREA